MQPLTFRDEICSAETAGLEKCPISVRVIG